MHENIDKLIEKVYIILPVNEYSYKDDNRILETKSLIYSADAECVGYKIVKVREITPSTYIGKGKLEEIKLELDGLNADLIVFDGVLSPSQTLNIAEVLQTTVVDRTTLILDIFAKNAKTLEGKLQVELAQLNYLYPRLKGKGQALSRLGGGIGTRGPGETQLETDRRHIRRRIDTLKELLNEQISKRELQKYRRAKNNDITVSLVGYTNTGKSTLLNKITGSNVLSEDKLFATLDPTVRKAKFGEIEVLLTDTVGFIKDIPTNLIEAFKSTLESAVFADLNLIILDASGDWENELDVTRSTIASLGSTTPEILVFNKCDKITDYTVYPKNSVFISALTGLGLDSLTNKIVKFFNSLFTKITLNVKYSDFSKFNNLYQQFALSGSLNYENEYITANFTVRKIYADKFYQFK